MQVGNDIKAVKLYQTITAKFLANAFKSFIGEAKAFFTWIVNPQSLALGGLA